MSTDLAARGRGPPRLRGTGLIGAARAAFLTSFQLAALVSAVVLLAAAVLTAITLNRREPESTR
jgi:hypothetical protein